MGASVTKLKRDLVRVIEPENGTPFVLTVKIIEESCLHRGLDGVKEGQTVKQSTESNRMKKQQIAEFIRLWKQAAEATKAANEIKDQIRDEVLGLFFEARHGNEHGEDTVRIETDAGTVLVSFTKAYRSLDASERDRAAEIVGPLVKKHFRPSWTVELDGLTEAEAAEIEARFGDRAKAEKVYASSGSWHSDRHWIEASKLVELERALRIERVNVSVAK